VAHKMVGTNSHQVSTTRGPLQRRRVTPRRFRTLRRAFTLLEVILSLVILGAALAIFGEVMQLANQNAADARAETQAQLLASSLMDEILAGSIDDSPANRQPLEVDDEVRWIYSVSTGTATVEVVYPLVVEVEQDVEAKFNPVKYRLVRWLSTTPEGSEAEEEADADSQQRSQQSQDQSSGGQQQQGGAGTAGGAGQAGGAGSAGGSQR
jgi:prepilin-type N-terminal cleavage/methylation domain-containing protein